MADKKLLESNNTSFDIDSFIKQITIIQRSQVTGVCPKGHMFCISADCWVVNDKKGAKDAKLV
jgi:hypothetical protein|tara:strand:- start:439 stop:627 length:189 start_codon:yes stop_codon:yes gene_type:complete